MGNIAGSIRTHGMTYTREYRIWKRLKGRVGKDDNYKHVNLCDRWYKFENFIADMGRCPSNEHSIDRYPNNNGNYEPGNCRWATEIEQQNNRRNNVHLIAYGVKRTVAEWARYMEIPVSSIWGRIKLGWPDEDIITVPYSISNRRCSL